MQNQISELKNAIVELEKEVEKNERRQLIIALIGILALIIVSMTLTSCIYNPANSKAENAEIQNGITESTYFYLKTYSLILDCIKESKSETKTESQNEPKNIIQTNKLVNQAEQVKNSD